MQTKTVMDRVRLTGTVLVTPFLVGAAVFGVWGLIDRLANWKALAQGGGLNEIVQGSQVLFTVAAIPLALIFTASLWRRCFPRRRAWEDDAVKLPSPFSTSGKYAVWRFQRPPGRRAVFGALRVRKKVRPSGLSR